MGIAVRQAMRSATQAVFPVTMPTAIIIASVVVGLSIVGTGLGSHYLADRYELSVDANSGPLGWRLYKRTGAVVVCELAKNLAAKAPPPGPNPFAEWATEPLPPIKGSRYREVDKVIVECGYE